MLVKIVRRSLIYGKGRIFPPFIWPPFCASFSFPLIFNFDNSCSSFPRVHQILTVLLIADPIQRRSCLFLNTSFSILFSIKNAPPCEDGCQCTVQCSIRESILTDMGGERRSLRPKLEEIEIRTKRTKTTFEQVEAVADTPTPDLSHCACLLTALGLVACWLAASLSDVLC